MGLSISRLVKHVVIHPFRFFELLLAEHADNVANINRKQFKVPKLVLFSCNHLYVNRFNLLCFYRTTKCTKRNDDNHCRQWTAEWNVLLLIKAMLATHLGIWIIGLYLSQGNTFRSHNLRVISEFIMWPRQKLQRWLLRFSSRKLHEADCNSVKANYDTNGGKLSKRRCKRVEINHLKCVNGEFDVLWSFIN